MQLTHVSSTISPTFYQYDIYVIKIAWRSVHQPCVFRRWTYLLFWILLQTLYFDSFWCIALIFITTYWTCLICISAQKYVTAIRSLAHNPSAKRMFIFTFGLIYSKIHIIYMFFACRTVNHGKQTIVYFEYK